MQVESNRELVILGATMAALILCALVLAGWLGLYALQSFEAAAAVDQQHATATSVAAAQQATSTTLENAARETEISDWAVLVDDTYAAATNIYSWPRGTVGDYQWTGNRVIQGGSYSWNVRALEPGRLLAIPRVRPASDFNLSVDVRLDTWPSVPVSGLVFDYSNSENYGFFLAGNDRSFSIGQVRQGQLIRLVSPSRTGSMRAGQPNRLAVEARGVHLRFLINDTLVWELEGDAGRFGKAGLLVELDGDQATTVQFDNFNFRAPVSFETQAFTFVDRFVSSARSASYWPTGTIPGRIFTGQRFFTPGAYRWEASTSGPGTLTAVPELPAVSDFTLIADMRQSSGSNRDWMGVVFRYLDEENHYAFWIQEGYFTVMLRSNGRSIVLIPSTVSGAVVWGKVNRLKVRAEGSRFAFWINDQKVGEIQDQTLGWGRAGLVLSLAYGNEHIVEFSDFEIKSPPDEASISP